ncbi:hypothetical protein ILUMI_21712 [Ignelater luminosus]|uniref:Glucosidase II subunit alpha n=1 Tax=Ignelater luminosus TaxID=2038154 RepID=A0A8K0CE28_IGNLU|nr:hypothetical protein ILUMI_21712 [Ignelater luminosus]
MFKVIFRCVLFLTLLYNITSQKTCAETFCGKLRKSPKGFPSYSLDLSTAVVVENHKLMGNLSSEDGTRILYLEVFCSVSHTLVGIEDIQVQQQMGNVNSFIRHSSSVPQTLKKTTNDNETIILTFVNTKAVVYANPFKIEVHYKDTLVATINGKGRLVIQNSAAALDVTFPGAQHAYGIPLHAENLALRTTTNGDMDPYRLYNHNSGQYKLKSTEALQSSVPLLYTHGKTQSSGIFWTGFSQSWVDITHGNNRIDTYIMNEMALIGTVIFNGPTIANAVAQGALIRNNPFTMPKYSTLGYHQSRNSYASQNEVLNLINQFKTANLPLESVWLDINHTDNGKYFTWDPVRFSNPIGLLNELAADNRSLVITIGPHIKREKGYFVHEEASSKRYYIRNIDGTDYIGKSLPGECSYIDFVNPNAMKYYSSLFSLEIFKADNLLVFLDLNEPTVFDNELHENTLPSNLLLEYDEESFLPYTYLHNRYVDYQLRATFLGIGSNLPLQARPFIATHSHSMIDMSFNPVITGDNYASWEHLQISFPMCLSEALGHTNMCGANVGGFAGIPDEELYQRWYQAGAWLPFYRAHFASDVPPREPYVYSDKVKNRVRNALYQRYAHLPVWYTLVWEVTITLKPIIRPLLYHYPKEEATFTIDNELLLGADILAAPVVKRGALMVSVYLPGGESEVWYNIDDNYKALRGVGHQIFNVNLDSVPVFYRGGSIIARKDTPRLTSAATVSDPYTLFICLNTTNGASGTLYVDDYETMNYFWKTEYLYMGFSFTDNSLYAYKIHENADYEGAAPVGEILVLNPPRNVVNARLEIRHKIRDNFATISYSNEGHVLKLSNLSLNLREPFRLTLLPSV